MLIPLSIGSLRTAAAACIIEQQEQLDSDKAKLAERSYANLHAGAAHNGMTITTERDKEMRDMAARDVDHIMGDHPSKEIIDHVELMLAAADFVEPDTNEVVIDTEEFKLLQKHLPARGNPKE
jgi:hypothetical protein